MYKSYDPSALLRRHRGGSNRQTVQRKGFSLYRNLDAAYFRPQYPLHIVMVQGAMLRPWNRSKYKYRVPPTNWRPIRADKPDHGRTLANILQPPSGWLGRMACGGTVHHKQLPFQHHKEGTIWTLDGTYSPCTSSRKGPQGSRPDNITKDPWIDKERSCAGHAAHTGVMGQTHQLQAIQKGRPSVVGRHKSTHHTPDTKVRTKAIWTIRSSRNGGTSQLSPGATISLEDTWCFSHQASSSI